MELTHSYSYDLSTTVSRDKLMALQQAIQEQDDHMTAEELEAEMNVHHFAPHVYGREMRIPAGTYIVGKIHKHAHLNVITKGVIKVVTEFGEDIYEGPKIWVSEPGTKRAVLALEDTQWLTIHPNFDDTDDLEALEKYVIAESYEELDNLLEGETL